MHFLFVGCIDSLRGALSRFVASLIQSCNAYFVVSASSFALVHGLQRSNRTAFHDPKSLHHVLSHGFLLFFVSFLAISFGGLAAAGAGGFDVLEGVSWWGFSEHFFLDVDVKNSVMLYTVFVLWSGLEAEVFMLYIES